LGIIQYELIDVVLKTQWVQMARDLCEEIDKVSS